MNNEKDREGNELLEKILDYQTELKSRDIIRNISKDLPKDKKEHDSNNSVQWLIVFLLCIGACLTFVLILPKNEKKSDNIPNPSVNVLPNLPINNQ